MGKIISCTISPPCNFELKNSHGSAWELTRGLFVDTSDSDSVKDTARRKRLWIFSKSEIIHHRARKKLDEYWQHRLCLDETK